jgi:predicted phage terminase large subunit-like protein
VGVHEAVRHARRSIITALEFSQLPPADREWFFNGLTARAKEALLYDWSFWAREKQLLPPGDWRNWLIMAGRGFGKTRTGAETVRTWAESGKVGRMALVARTASDVRDVLVEGESGILSVCPRRYRPTYNPSKRRLTWPNGCLATLYSADEPDLLRGPQHEKAWSDEVASWRYPEAWDMLQFGLRLGDNPQNVLTTTPRPTKLMKEIRDDPATVLTIGTTYENRANLAPAFFSQIVRKYEGTRLGQQELLAKLLEDNPDALWRQSLIDQHRWIVDRKLPDMVRIVVAIDPAITDAETSSETGMIVVGRDAKNHGYVLEDLSFRGTPDEWGAAAVRAYFKHDADRIVAETNQGGQMVEQVIRTVAKTIGKPVSYRGVRASRGKLTRAEPVSALYEQGLVHHVGLFPELEDQMTSWTPGEVSPDRMDALVWGVHEMFIEGGRSRAPIGV